jgi:uncharacterized protein (UPF0548 family)
MFALRRPSSAFIRRFLESSAERPLSYERVGLAREPVAGFDVDEQIAVVGYGEHGYRRAITALRDWRHFDLGWVEVFPARAPLTPGTVVAALIRHAGLWSLNGCRVVYGIGTPEESRFGFAYGTLTNHAECGEEIFEVALSSDTGAVSYTIRAASKPREPLARLGYPIARVYQARFRRDSAQAMTRAVADQGHHPECRLID